MPTGIDSWHSDVARTPRLTIPSVEISAEIQNMRTTNVFILFLGRLMFSQVMIGSLQEDI